MAKFITVKDFVKCLNTVTEIHTFGWFNSDKYDGIYTSDNIPDYFKDLPVKHYSYNDDILNLYLAYSKEAY